MSTTINAKYHCTQAELYPICILGWNFAKKHQIEIEPFFPEYTVVYIDDKLAQITAAELLPDFQSRDALTEEERIILTKTAKLAIKKWDLLERYIIRALQSDKDLIKPNLEDAGSKYYRAATATQPNWEDLKKMLVSGNKYIIDNAALLAPVMPAGFPLSFKTQKDKFESQYAELLLNRVEAPAETIEKLNANNAIFDDLMLMLGDIKALTPDELDDDISFAYLKGIISSPGPAGLKGLITQQGSTVKINGALCRLLETDYETTSDTDGFFDFGNIASGKYTIQISKDGYQTLDVSITIFTGVTSTKNFELVTNP
jgi:hypothetical protein